MGYATYHDMLDEAQAEAEQESLMGDLRRTITEEEYEEYNRLKDTQAKIETGKLIVIDEAANSILKSINKGDTILVPAFSGKPTQDTLETVCKLWHKHSGQHASFFVGNESDMVYLNGITGEEMETLNALRAGTAAVVTTNTKSKIRLAPVDDKDYSWSSDLKTEHKRTVLHLDIPDNDEMTVFLINKRAWSLETFGPGFRTKGIDDHIKKELREIEKNPFDLEEWIDGVLLFTDGFWRHGGDPLMFMSLLKAKHAKNVARTWPDWRTMSEDVGIEHDRSAE